LTARGKHRRRRRGCSRDARASRLAGLAGYRTWRRLPHKLRNRLTVDHLVRNSLYLVLSSGLQATLGFAFWLVTARWFSVSDVGRASALISATILIAYLALLGLNSTFVLFLPTSPDRDVLLTAGLLVVAVCGAGFGLLYVAFIPVLAPSLAFVSASTALAAGFVLLASAGAVNLLTDSVFIAARRSGYNALVDGGIGGLSKLVFAVVLAGTGSYGLFSASASSYVAAGLASVILMTTALHYRPSFREPVRVIKPLLRYSAASYLANNLGMLPSVVLPVIVLDRLGPSAAAYYFVAYQVSTLLYSAAYAVEQAFLAEGGQVAGKLSAPLLRHSWLVLMSLCLPACALLMLAAPRLLLAFGVTYSRHGTLPLIVLAAAAPPLAMNNWLQVLLRLLGRLRALMLSASVQAIAICGLAWILAPHGDAAVAAAWPAGGLLGTAVSAVPCRAALRNRRITSLTGKSAARPETIESTHEFTVKKERGRGHGGQHARRSHAIAHFDRFCLCATASGWRGDRGLPAGRYLGRIRSSGHRADQPVRGRGEQWGPADAAVAHWPGRLPDNPNTCLEWPGILLEHRLSRVPAAAVALAADPAEP
jgi:O-antigen/teichoic acid export membrane protein